MTANIINVFIDALEKGENELQFQIGWSDMASLDRWCLSKDKLEITEGLFELLDCVQTVILCVYVFLNSAPSHPNNWYSENTFSKSYDIKFPKPAPHKSFNNS